MLRLHSLSYLQRRKCRLDYIELFITPHIIYSVFYDKQPTLLCTLFNVFFHMQTYQTEENSLGEKPYCSGIYYSTRLHWGGGL